MTNTIVLVVFEAAWKVADYRFPLLWDVLSEIKLLAGRDVLAGRKLQVLEGDAAVPVEIEPAEKLP